MWSDNETNRDFLNFHAVADTAAEVIIQAQGRPLSLGVSGGWGVGKSSMVKLIEESLQSRGEGRFLFVEFNAWLYQGFDDARAALMDVIAQALVDHGEKTKTGIDKAKELLNRVNWIRAASLTVGSAISVAMGLPPTGLIGEAVGIFKSFTGGAVDQKAIETATDVGKKIVDTGKELVNPREAKSPPKEIQDLRNHFQATLKEMNTTLVVFIDDLDRCLPNTAIATLEAIRLFLFLENTAFVIAADDKMIRQAVRSHFKDVELDDSLVTNYFDKLIQVPIRVPPLGTQDVRAYLMLLFLEKSGFSPETIDDLRTQICTQLGASWQGRRVDRAFVASLIPDCPPSVSAQLDLADRLAPLMTTAKEIAGNPRLIKRFLNTLSIRLAIAKSQHVTVDEAALAKMLLFERCAPTSLYSELLKGINESDEGKPGFLKKWEALAASGQKIEMLPPEWDIDFVRDWLALPPAFGDLDLRAVVYVSREQLPIITPSDQLSSDAAALLEALFSLKQEPNLALIEKLKKLPKREINLIMDRLLGKARQVQEWGKPSILHACLSVIDSDPDQGTRFAGFLEQIPGPQLKPSIVPILNDKPWAEGVLKKWNTNTDVPGNVKRAIEAQSREMF